MARRTLFTVKDFRVFLSHAVISKKESFLFLRKCGLGSEGHGHAILIFSIWFVSPLIILCTVANEIFKLFAHLSWATLFWNCSTVWTFSDLYFWETVPLFIPIHLTGLLPFHLINWLIARCSSSFFLCFIVFLNTTYFSSLLSPMSTLRDASTIRLKKMK